MKNSFPAIDIKKIIKTEYPKFYQKIFLRPIFFKFLETVIGQRIINNFIKENHQLNVDDFLANALTRYNITLKSIGLSDNHSNNIKKFENTIVVANHPVGGYDGVAFLYNVRQIIPSAKIIVNKILNYITNLKEGFIPITLFKNTGVKESLRANKKILEHHYSKSSPILIFPAGKVARKINGEVKDAFWHKHFIQSAIKYQKNIIPVFIDMKNSNWFYFLSHWRTKLKIKANIEMLFLFQESIVKQKNKTLPIHFGETIPHEILTTKYSPTEWADRIRNHVHSNFEKKWIR